jgi:hypothetical protein
MSIGVVDLLEIVKVKHQNGIGKPQAPGMLKLAGENLT